MYKNGFRYLITGFNFSALEFYFARDNNTNSKIVADAIRNKWECLKKKNYMLATVLKLRCKQLSGM